MAPVVAIRRPDGFLIGTGTAVGAGRVVTALHVVDGEPALVVADGMAVVASVSLPVRRYGPARRLARSSYRRTGALVGGDVGTVDLALLVVPALRAPPLPVRPGAVHRGEWVRVPGFPAGCRSTTAGPITSHDEADFVAHLMLGPGCSGAPALDAAGRLLGIATLDHDSAGGVFVGPTLLAAFVDRTRRLVAHLLPC